MLLIEVQLDDPTARLTHSTVYAEEYFALLNLAPNQLKIAGPSVSLLNEMIIASDALLDAAPTMTVDLLIIQAESDYLVDNAAHDEFLDKVGEANSTQLICDSPDVMDTNEVCRGVDTFSNRLERMKGAYHVLLNEEDAIYQKVIALIQQRLAR